MCLGRRDGPVRVPKKRFIVRLCGHPLWSSHSLEGRVKYARVGKVGPMRMAHSRSHLLSVLGVFLLMLLVGGNAQAALFNFDELAGGAGSGPISDYMTDVYGSDVSVTGATVYPVAGSDPLSASGWSNTTPYIAEADQGAHQFTITFEVPITSVSFSWARVEDPLKLEAAYAGGTVQVFSVGTGQANGGTGYGYETIDLLAMVGAPVTSLFFHDGGQGAIGIDNLTVVSAVPLHASMLLGAFAVGLAGRKLRKFV